MSIVSFAATQMESLLDVYLSAYLSEEAFARVWPLSKASLPAWGGFLGLLMVTWVFNFIVIKKPDAIKRDEEKRGKFYHEMMKAVLTYSSKEELKSEEERKRPEASRVYKLLWDDVHKVRTTKYGIAKNDKVNVQMEALLQRLLVHELKKAVKYTTEANKDPDNNNNNNNNAPDPDADADAVGDANEITVFAADNSKIEPPSKDEIKTIAEHKSGDKLHSVIRFNKEVAKNMGKQFVDKGLITRAQKICKELCKKQSKKANSVLALVGPVIPHAIKMILICCLRTALCAKFHQIGVWVHVIEVGAAGDMAQAIDLLFELWLGHMFIKLLDLPEHTYRKRAKSMFGSRIRNGVLAAMVRQDYEYFDKNSTGVLQERLNRDADELGDNLIGFPQEMLEKLTWISVNLYIVYHQCPWGLFTVAIWPVIMMMTFQYFMFRYFRKCEERMRRVGQEGVRVTSEVLRQIKTVRQFAMEPQSAAQFARSNISRHMMVEQVHIVTECARTFVWSLFDSGIALTILFGLPYVASGQMSTAALIDTFCKINFNICFCLREFLEKLPKAAELLQPLGRICDLLDSTSLIEPNSDPAFVDCACPEDLTALLALCELDDCDRQTETEAEAERSVGASVGTSVAGLEGATATPTTTPTATGGENRYYRRPTRTVATVTIVGGPSPTKTTATATAKAKAMGGGMFAGPGAKQGAQLLSLTTDDHRYITVCDKSEVDPYDMTYPVRATFSTKLRPARFKGKIEFRNVTFCYPTELRTPVLQGINFVVEPGQKVALVGATGCGKSSCMALLQRLYDPQEGTILIDDIPLQNYDIHFLRSRIVIVDQHTVLFTATIRDNITYGMDEKSVTDEMVIQACKDAKAWDFIDEKPDKLLTMISSGGSNLSGGQRQRLAIARAIIRRPDVILLDEATSALDNTNETLVQQALDKLMKNGSALVIAHRLSTIRDSDKIIVVDHGKNAEEGSHDHLLAEGPAIESGAAMKAKKDAGKAETVSAPGDYNIIPPPAEGELQCTVATLAELPPPPAANPTLGRAKTSHEALHASTPSGRASGLKWDDLSDSDTKDKEGMTYRKLWDAASGVKSGQSLRNMEEKIITMEAQLKEYKSKVAAMKEQKDALLNGRDLNGAGAADGASTNSNWGMPMRAPGLARAISSQ